MSETEIADYGYAKAGPSVDRRANAKNGEDSAASSTHEQFLTVRRALAG
jgi:hypothetical protein